jgi:hypothetical protein
MEELIAYIAKSLVDQPDMVRVSRTEENDSVIIELAVAPDDLGKVIGKQGRTARAMRSLLAAALFFLAASVWAAEQKATGINALEAGKREFQQRNFDSALTIFNDSEKRGDATSQSFILKGRIYAEQQKYEEAASAFDAAYKLEPASFARLYLADMFVAQKKWQEARAIYESAMKETNILVSNERLRYGVLISSLGAKDDEGARVAFEKLPFPTETAAYYYAQAAWAFAHGAKGDGDKWLRRGDEIFPAKSTAW